jgi:hypothetical protein
MLDSAGFEQSCSRGAPRRIDIFSLTKPFNSMKQKGVLRYAKCTPGGQPAALTLTLYLL